MAVALLLRNLGVAGGRRRHLSGLFLLLAGHLHNNAFGIPFRNPIGTWPASSLKHCWSECHSAARTSKPSWACSTFRLGSTRSKARTADAAEYE